MRTILLFTLCFSFSTLFLAKQALAEQSPKAQVISMIDALKKVEKDNASTYKNVDTYINYDLLTGESIAPHRSKFTDKQADIFVKKFRILIRKVAYPQSSTFYNDAKSVYQPTVVKGKTALILAETSIEKEDFEMEIGYAMTKTKNDWRLSDLLIDEDSLVKDYQNQFGRIISKEGVDGLIKKIEAKIAEIDAENSKK